MTFELLRRYRFEAAHYLPTVPGDHPCRRLHGHTYHLEVTITGSLEQPHGWVIDYATIDAAVTPLLAQVDHVTLNDVEGLENPTSEHLASWLWHRLAPVLKGLAAVTIAENEDSSCTYRGAQA